ncbi:MAG: radical SAM protein [Candidatus Omnitrophota bacterium]
MLNLKEVIFSITNRCNLRCRMCDIPCGKIEELSTDQWKKVINDSSRLGAQTVVFSGGEPLLREDIFELIFFAKKNNLNACVTSNGCLIDEQVASRLSASGANVVNISIEGTKGTHDYLRGPGSFDKAASALANLRKYKIETTVASTVSRYNYEDLLYVLEIAGEYGATTVRLQPFNAIFLKDSARAGEFLIDKREIPKIEDIIHRFIDISQERKISTNPANYLFKIPAYLTGKKFHPDNCGALRYSCPINSNGDIFPCWIEASHNKLIGNIREESLYELWLSEKRRKLINSIINNGCSGCLMSCYDEVFGSRFSKAYILDKAKKVKRIASYRKLTNKALQFLKSQVIKMKLRYRFYSSYKGSVTNLLKRRLPGIFNKFRRIRESGGEDKEIILSEISRLKRKLREEIHSL